MHNTTNPAQNEKHEILFKKNLHIYHNPILWGIGVMQTEGKLGKNVIFNEKKVIIAAEKK